MEDIVVSTAIGSLYHTAIYLVVIAILFSPVIFLARNWLGRKWWRVPATLAVVALPVAAMSLYQEIYAPPLGYNPPMARYWIQRAAEAPTREVRVMHVRRVATSSPEYGGHIAWGGIRHIPDARTRCDLYRIVNETPNIKSSGNVQEALAKDCAD